MPRSFDEAYDRDLSREPGPRNRREPVQLDELGTVKRRFTHHAAQCVCSDCIGLSPRQRMRRMAEEK